jgi:hypothetical protein
MGLHLEVTVRHMQFPLLAPPNRAIIRVVSLLPVIASLDIHAHARQVSKDDARRVDQSIHPACLETWKMVESRSGTSACPLTGNDRIQRHVVLVFTRYYTDPRSARRRGNKTRDMMREELAACLNPQRMQHM